MSLKSFLPLVSAMVLPLAAVAFGSAPLRAAAAPRVDAAISHENLTVYLLRGASEDGPVPLTLAEAMARGAVNLHETGTVNALQLENTGSEAVFVQAGDIVKGGKQDRVLTVSLLVPAKSGKVPIGAYCVEQGRWAARGKEDVKTFASADKALPSREAKLAMLKPAPERPASVTAAAPAPAQAAANTANRIPQQQRITGGYDGGSSRQGEMWASVGKVQEKLTKNLAAPVAATASASSLQLSLENKKLAEARAEFVSKLKSLGEAGDDVVGVVIAINGRINSAEIYPSNGLFRKMWPKLLDASATEAIGEKDGARAAAPDVAAVETFLATAGTGKMTEAKLNEALVRDTREAAGALIVETRRKSGGFVHRSYLAY